MTRTITTLEERWALPRGTVIRDAAGVAWVKHPNSWRASTPIEHDQWIVLPATVLHDPSVPAPAPSEATDTVATPPVMRIEGTWLAEFVDEHTCGAGPGSGTGMHEPGCGLVPVLDLATLPGWDEHLTAAPAPAPSMVSEAAVEALDALVKAAKVGVVGSVRQMVDDFAKDVRAGLLTAAPSATRDEVARLIDPSGWRYFDTGMFPPDHPASTGVVHNSRETADALLARYNMTRKEDR